MPGKKKATPGSTSTTSAPASDAPPVNSLETALGTAVTGMKVDMAKNILAAAEPPADGGKKRKKNKNKKKKKQSSSSEASQSSDDSFQVDENELALQLALKPKHMKLKDMTRYQDLSAVALNVL